MSIEWNELKILTGGLGDKMMKLYLLGCFVCWIYGIILFIKDENEKLYRTTVEYRNSKFIYYLQAFFVSIIISITSWIGVLLLIPQIIKRKK